MIEWDPHLQEIVMRLFALPALFVLMATAGAQSTSGEPSSESKTKIAALRKERIAALKELSATSMKLAQASRIEMSEVLDDQAALLKAELEVAGTDADRIALYKASIDNLKTLEEMARAQLNAGRGTMHSVLKVKARRLEVEIQLEQTKAGAK